MILGTMIVCAIALLFLIPSMWVARDSDDNSEKMFSDWMKEKEHEDV